MRCPEKQLANPAFTKKMSINHIIEHWVCLLILDFFLRSI